MIELLCLLAILHVGVGATDELQGSPIYSMLPSSSPLFDQSLLGSSQLQTAATSVGRPGQLLSYSQDGGFGATTTPISPMILQPPGNIQYANMCDPSERKELFKKCLADQLSRLKNVIENCKKALGEDAKECCVDNRCLDAINGGSGSGEDDDDRACRDKRCRERIADEILKNIDTGQLMKSLLDPLKSSLKKIGNKLGSLTACTRSRGCKGTDGPSLLAGGEVPPGILIYPTEPNKFETITNMLGSQQRPQLPRDPEFPGSGPQGPQGNPNNVGGPCSAGGWGGMNTQCPPSWAGQPSGWNSAGGWGSMGGWNNGGSNMNNWDSRPSAGTQQGSWIENRYPSSSSSLNYPSSISVSESTVCTPQMCASPDRYDSPETAARCEEYCKRYRGRQNNNMRGDEPSDLSDESCSNDGKK